MVSRPKREIRSYFLKVRCPKCGNEQIIYSHASIPGGIRCLVCGTLLAKTTGGKIELAEGVEVVEVLGKIEVKRRVFPSSASFSYAYL